MFQTIGYVNASSQSETKLLKTNANVGQDTEGQANLRTYKV